MTIHVLSTKVNFHNRNYSTAKLRLLSLCVSCLPLSNLEDYISDLWICVHTRVIDQHMSTIICAGGGGGEGGREGDILLFSLVCTYYGIL